MSKNKRDITAQLEEEMFNLTTEEVKRTRYDEYGNRYLEPKKSEKASMFFIAIVAFFGSLTIGASIFGPTVGFVAAIIIFMIFISLLDKHAKNRA